MTIHKIVEIFCDADHCNAAVRLGEDFTADIPTELKEQGWTTEGRTHYCFCHSIQREIAKVKRHFPYVGLYEVRQDGEHLTTYAKSDSAGQLFTTDDLWMLLPCQILTWSDYLCRTRCAAHWEPPYKPLGLIVKGITEDPEDDLFVLVPQEPKNA